MADTNRALLILAVIAVIVALVAAVSVYFAAGTLLAKISGYATSGEANLTISSQAQVNFTTDAIEWGHGQVDAGQGSATLSSLGQVLNGNWSTVTQGFVVENIGNNNLALNITAGKTAAAFIGGSNPVYGWNVSDVEANSCRNTTGSGNIEANMNYGVWRDATTTEYVACNIFPFEASFDTVRIDINVTIPENAPTGVKTDTITAIVTAL